MAMPELGLDAPRSPETADPFAEPAYIDEVLLKRTFAFAIDCLLVAIASLAAWFVFGVLSVLSLGLLGIPVAPPLVALAYFVLFTGLGRRATPGMAALGVELRSIDGRPAHFVQAALRVLLHWGSLSIPLLFIGGAVWALFDDKRRMLHDILSGTVMINRLSRAPAGV